MMLPSPSIFVPELYAAATAQVKEVRRMCTRIATNVTCAALDAALHMHSWRRLLIADSFMNIDGYENDLREIHELMRKVSDAYRLEALNKQFLAWESERQKNALAQAHQSSRHSILAALSQHFIMSFDATTLTKVKDAIYAELPPEAQLTKHVDLKKDTLNTPNITKEQNYDDHTSDESEEEHGPSCPR